MARTRLNCRRLDVGSPTRPVASTKAHRCVARGTPFQCSRRQQRRIVVPVCVTAVASLFDMKSSCRAARPYFSTRETEAAMRQSDTFLGTEPLNYEQWSALLRPVCGRHTLVGLEPNTFSGRLRALSVSGLAVTATDIS